MPQTACRNSKPFRFQDLSKIGIFASRTGSSPPPPSYDNQSLQLFSGSIHRRPIKFGMLVYHIIAQGQFFYFFEIRNIFRKIAFFSNFLGLSKFHRIPASVYYDLQLYYSSEVDKTWHARLSHYCAEPNLLIFRKFELFFEQIRVFGTWSIPPSTANSCTIRIDWESHYCAGTILFSFFEIRNNFSKNFVFLKIYSR